jgi:hypothetical protein
MSQIPVNVDVDEDQKQRILAEEERWDGKKLVILTLVTLAITLASLYAMANAWYWMHKI